MEQFPFSLFARCFWLIALGISLINYVMGRRRITAAVGQNPNRLGETLGLFGRLSLFSNLPWRVMGWGVLFGSVPSVFSYFRLQDRNTYVIDWYASLMLLSVSNALWVMLGDGARRLRELQAFGAFGAGRKTSAMPDWAIKVLAILGPFFILFWLYWMRFITSQTLP